MFQGSWNRYSRWLLWLSGRELSAVNNGLCINHDTALKFNLGNGKLTTQADATVSDCSGKRPLALGLSSVAGDVLNGEGTCESEDERKLVTEVGQDYRL